MTGHSSLNKSKYNLGNHHKYSLATYNYFCQGGALFTLVCGPVFVISLTDPAVTDLDSTGHIGCMSMDDTPPRLCSWCTLYSNEKCYYPILNSFQFSVLTNSFSVLVDFIQILFRVTPFHFFSRVT